MKLKLLLWVPGTLIICVLLGEIAVRLSSFDAYAHTYAVPWKPRLCRELLKNFAISDATYSSDFVSRFEIIPVQISKTDPGLRITDSELGVRLNPNYSGRTLQTNIKGHTNFNVQYSIDGFGRRITKDADVSSQTKSLLLFGSSDLFGYGVNDDETLAFYLADQTKTFEVVNYGVDLWGPGNVMKFIQSPNFSHELKHREALAIYYFNYHHLTRLIGSLNLYRYMPSWPASLPYFKIENDVLLQDRMLSSRSTDPIFRFFSRSFLLNWLDVDYPTELCTSDLELFTEVIHQMGRSLKEKLNSANLIVLFQPDSPKALTQILIALLKEKGIESLNYSELDLQPLTSESVRLPDSHPSPAWNRLLANQIIQDLRLK